MNQSSDISTMEPIMTVPQVADRWGVSRNTVYDLISDGKIPHMRFGRKDGTIRIRPEDVRAYEASCLVTGSPDPKSTGSNQSSGMLSGERVEGVTARRVASATRAMQNDG